MPRSKKYSKEELIEMVNDFDNIPTQKEFSKENSISPSTIYRYFDSWNDLLLKSNFKSINETKEYDEREILDEIQKVCNNFFNGFGCSSRDFNKYSEINDDTVANHFGSWNKGLRKAGFKPVQRRNISNEELLEELKRIAEEYCPERPNSFKHKTFVEHGKYSSSIYKSRFGTFNNAMEKVGLKPRTKSQVEKEFLINEIKRVSREFCDGQRPTQSDINKYGKFSNITYYNKFNSWNQAIEEAGFNVYTHPTGEDNPRWNGGDSQRYYGPSWRSQRRKAWSRDQYRCQVCLKSEKEIGFRPDVHHIIPVRFWDVEAEHETMNSLKNIVSLCKRCHTKYGREEKLFKNTRQTFLNEVKEMRENEK